MEGVDIVGWERSRYRKEQLERDVPLDEFSGNSVAFRMFLAKRLLRERARGAVVLDIGCGSGILLDLLRPFGPRMLHGLDSSAPAVALARTRIPAEECSFAVGDALTAPLPPSDVVVGLGLLDWLSPEEHERLFARLERRPFLFSFSEDENSLRRRLHKLYTLARYGWGPKSPTMRYYSAERMSSLAQRHGYAPPRFIRHPRLGFGAMMASFPPPPDAL